jgi:hypothetical protein
MLFFDRSPEGLDRVMGIMLGQGRTLVSEDLLGRFH